MRVLICPTAFKGTFGASEVAEAMGHGVRSALARVRIRTLPLSDGGPGLIESLQSVEEGRVLGVDGVSGPRADPADGGTPADAGGRVRGRVLLLDGGRTAVVESADACGLGLLPGSERDPLRTHTRGVGELLRVATGEGAASVAVGLGGSATCDGGAGAARQFGYRFLDGRGEELPDGGGALTGLDAIRPPSADGGGPKEARSAPELLALADVDNPLLGSDGAAATYGPQKGAGREDVRILEDGLGRLVEVAAGDLAADPAGVRAAAERPGAGAAGGLAFGLEVFLGASVTGGTAWVLRRVGFDRALREADLVVTGEGAYDRTTDRGKVVGEVVRRSREAGVPVRLVCGRIEGELPPGVRGVDGSGGILDAGGVAGAAARAVAGADGGDGTSPG